MKDLYWKRFARLTSPATVLFKTVNILVLVYAGLMVLEVPFMLVNTARPARAQSAVQEYKLQSLEKRMDAFEAMRIGERMAVLEELAKATNANSYWGPMSMGGVGLLIAREAFKALREKASSDKDGDE